VRQEGEHVSTHPRNGAHNSTELPIILVCVTQLLNELGSDAEVSEHTLWGFCDMLNDSTEVGLILRTIDGTITHLQPKGIGSFNAGIKQLLCLKEGSGPEHPVVHVRNLRAKVAVDMEHVRVYTNEVFHETRTQA